MPSAFCGFAKPSNSLKTDSILAEIGLVDLGSRLASRRSASFSDGVGHNFCEMVIGVLGKHYQDEYTMLTYLARGDKDDFVSLADSDPTYTQHLIGYGVINKSPNGYDFKIDAVKKHLSKKERYKKLNLNDTEKLAEISARRNEIEHRLRRLVSQILRSTLGEEDAKRLVLAKHDIKKRAKGLSLNNLYICVPLAYIFPHGDKRIY